MSYKIQIKHKFAFVFLTCITVALFGFLYPYGAESEVLNPVGMIGIRERDLIFIATLLMSIVVVPVFILTFAVCLRYRASNKDAEYTPNWDNDWLAEAIWWGFPLLIVIFLSLVTWKSSHELDPFKPFQTKVKPIRIQAIALQWKWLFIYPEYDIATVNYFQFPEQTPLNFEITADAPMNSFWLPSLGGQVYAMPGMKTKLHLISHEVGEFHGSSANLSGTGFAGMRFMAKAVTSKDFEEWVKSAQQSKEKLDWKNYLQLAKPNEYVPETTYSLNDKDLYEQIVMKYMKPPEEPAL